MSKLLKEIRSFFESYEVMNEITDTVGIRVEIFESIKKDLLQIKVIERCTFGTAKDKNQRNMFCDIKVEGICVKMLFRFEKIDNNIKMLIKSLIKPDYKIQYLGNSVTISVIEPRISEIQNIFNKLEPRCRRFKL